MQIGFNNPLSRGIKLNLFILGFLYFLAIFADFLCPLSPLESPPIKVSYSPPIKLKWSIDKGLYFHPFKSKIDKNTLQKSFLEDTSKTCLVGFFAQGSSYKLFGFISMNKHLIASPNCPQSFNLLGADRLGRDFLSRLIHGLRPALFSGLLGILISFPLGIIYGAIAGYKGQTLGESMMRLVEVILSFPTLYLLIVMAALLPAGLGSMQRLLLITAILSLIGWAGLARVVRGQVLSVSKREYVQAAILNGQSEFNILLREVIPQLSTYLIIAATLSFPSFILGETSLSFLGLGINQPDASLGNILAESRELTNLFLRPWLAICPSLVIVLLTWCCNSLGDQLRDVFDPKS